MEPNIKPLPKSLDLFKESVNFYKKNYKTLIPIGLVMVVLSVIEDFLNVIKGPEGSANSLSIVLAIIAFGIISAVLNVLSQIGYIRTIKDLETGVSPSVGSVYNGALSIFWSYLWMAIITVMILLGASVFFIIPMIILGGYFYLNAYALIIDGKRGFAALNTSFHYIENNWAAVLLKSLGLSIFLGIFYLAIIIISFIVIWASNTIFGDISNIYEPIWSIFLSFIAACIVSPISLYYMYLIYKNLKLQKPEPDLTSPDVLKRNKIYIACIVIAIIIILACLALALYFGGSTILEQIKNTNPSTQTPAILNALDFLFN